MYDSFLFGYGLTLAISNKLSKTSILTPQQKQILYFDSFFHTFVTSEDHKRIYRQFLRKYKVDSSKAAMAAESGGKTRLFHLRIEDPYDSAYWLDIEIAANATLTELDQFLRDIWLECCGHLSHFIVGDREIFYSSYIDPDPFWGSWKAEEYDLHVAIEKALPFNKKVQYEYDFGSTTELSVEIIAEREGSLPRGKKLRILSRNFSPLYDCSICGEEPAQWINAFEYEDNLYCDKHAKEHDEWGEGFLPLSNSPRAGVCGYEGTEIKEYEFERFV